MRFSSKLMDDFRQIFLAESITNLTVLREDLAAGFNQKRRDAFRKIHTVKGGLQTFGWQNAAQLAAELENILSKNDEFSDKNLFLEGVAKLIESLQTNEMNSSADLIERLQNSNKTTTRSEIFLTRIPLKIFKSFSPTEQNAVIFALRESKNIFSVTIGFEPANFADEYRNLRNILDEKDEIIAALPSEKYRNSGKIGFQIFFASSATVENLQIFLADFPVEISAYNCPKDASRDLFEIFSSIAGHGKNIADGANKTVDFSIIANDAKVSGAMRKTIFDILLHLVRNAVDHAIAENGKIEIRAFKAETLWQISVADDGKGVNLAKIRARAIEKKLISPEDILDERQTLELIFASELSTAETVTEISGRGVGLDAVKNAVENSHGKISVRRRKQKGTIFEIFLPEEI